MFGIHDGKARKGTKDITLQQAEVLGGVYSSRIPGQQACVKCFMVVNQHVKEAEMGPESLC